jgi:Skp family chaperone for outer membrane proteins
MKSKIAFSLVFTMLAAAAALAAPASAPQAAPAAASQFSFGTIDLSRIVKEHPVMIKWNDELDKAKTERSAQVEKMIKDKFGVTDLTQLTDQQRSQGQQVLAQEEERFKAEMGPKELEKMKQIESDIKEQGAVVATEKRLTFILDRSVVIYGGVDVTDSILDKIKAKYK